MNANGRHSSSSNTNVNLETNSNNLIFIQMKTGIELIAIERQEQIEKHGISLAEDTESNKECELSQVAIAMLKKETSYVDFPYNWRNRPFMPDVVKMMNKEYKERLIIAGALIAAEIDRLNSEKN